MYIYIYIYIVYSLHIYPSTLRTIFHSKSFFRITPTPLGVSRAKRCATDASRERLTWQSWRGEWPDRKTTGLAGYKISMTYLQNAYEISMKYLWHIYNIYIYMWDIYKMSMKFLPNILTKSQNVYEICMNFLSHILKISIKVSNVYEISTIYLHIYIYMLLIKQYIYMYMKYLIYLWNM